jgi:hypothetical protein
MYINTKAKRRSRPGIHPLDIRNIGVRIDACGLRSTLDAYVVEEITAENLVQFPPGFSVAEGGRDDI